MAKFICLVRAKAEVQAELEVEAESLELAEEQAIDLAENDADGTGWEMISSIGCDFHSVEVNDCWEAD